MAQTVIHSDRAPCTQQSEGKGWACRAPSIFSCFSQLFVLTFLVSWHHINQHLESQGNGGQGRRGRYQDPTLEKGRKERRREIGVSICHQMRVSPASSCPAALGSGGWLFPEANLSITWATTSPRTLFQWLLFCRDKL